MSGKSDYLENKLLDHVFGNAAYTQPTVYVGLWTATLGDSSTGSTAGEVSGGGYARAATAAADWSAAAAGQLDNATDLTFPEATESWGTVTDVAFLDASTLGNILYYSALSSSKKIEIGDTPKFAAGSVVISED